MATKLSQFNIFFRRTCLLLARDRHQFAVDCCIQLACGAFFGLLYENFEFKDAQTLFFMLNLGVGLTASLARAAKGCESLTFEGSVSQGSVSHSVSELICWDG